MPAFYKNTTITYPKCKKSVKESSFQFLPIHNIPVSLCESHPSVYGYDSWGKLYTLWTKHKGWRKSFHNWDKVFSKRYVLTLRKQFSIKHVTQHSKSWWQQSYRCKWHLVSWNSSMWTIWWPTIWQTFAYW